MSDIDLHKSLIGRQGSRRALNTPALVIDRDALQRNIEAMAAFARGKGIALRPHAKTHKSIDIARMQMAAGAVGVCCAKLGEAEVLAAGGTNAILITSPVVTPQAIERLIALNGSIGDLRVVIDNAASRLQAPCVSRACSIIAARSSISKPMLIAAPPSKNGHSICKACSKRSIARGTRPDSSLAAAPARMRLTLNSAC